MRAIFAFDPAIDPDRFADDCRRWGLDTAILHPGFLGDDRMSGALDDAGLSLWLNVPVFFDGAYLEQHPEAYAVTSQGRRAAHDWLHFVCPSDDAHLEHIVGGLRATLARLQPTVVSLDFIRHYAYWEGVSIDGPSEAIEDGCYCARCLAAFEAAAGVGVDRHDPVGELRGRSRPAWGEWKSGRITAVARRVFAEIRAAAPGARLAVKTVPWRATDLDGALVWSVGQDMVALGAEVDLVAPMAFTHLLRRTPAWKRDVLAEVRRTAGRPVVSYVQVGAVNRAEEITPAELDAELRDALADDVDGIVVFEYAQVVADPAKAELLRSHLLG